MATNTSATDPTTQQAGILAGAIGQDGTSNTQAAQTTAASYTPTTGTATGYDATGVKGTNWDLNDKSTVAGQLQGILASNSPLLQQAQTQALEQQNARGTLNSSMAIGEGQKALYSAALPIAQSDASINATAGKYNADVANSSEQFTAAAKNTENQFDSAAQNSQTQQNVTAQNTASSQNAQLSQANATANADASSKLQLQQISANTQTLLANIEATYKNQMQSSQSSSQMYAQTVQNISNIMMDKDLDATGKQAAINQQVSMLKSGFQVQENISGLDLGNILNFGNTDGMGSGSGSYNPNTADPSSTHTVSSPNGVLNLVDNPAINSIGGYFTPNGSSQRLTLSKYPVAEQMNINGVPNGPLVSAYALSDGTYLDDKSGLRYKPAPGGGFMTI